MFGQASENVRFRRYSSRRQTAAYLCTTFIILASPPRDGALLDEGFWIDVGIPNTFSMGEMNGAVYEARERRKTECRVKLSDTTFRSQLRFLEFCFAYDNLFPGKKFVKPGNFRLS